MNGISALIESFLLLPERSLAFFLPWTRESSQQSTTWKRVIPASRHAGT